MSLVRYPASPREVIMASDSNDLFIVDDDAMMRDALSRGFHACRLSRDRIRGWRDISGSGEHADTGCGAARSAPAGQIWSNGAERAECAQLSRPDLYSDG